MQGSEHRAALVQWALSAAETAGPEAFSAAVAGRAARACAAEAGDVRLLVFPEMSGLWLLLAELGGRAPADGMAAAGRAAAKGTAQREAVRLAGRLLRNPSSVLRLLSRGVGGVLDDDGWSRHLWQWLEPFREAARRHGVYVCPGSTLLPPFTRGPAGGLRFSRRGLANTGCLIAPNGRVLGFRRKLRLTPLERRAGIAPGETAWDLQPFDTELGRIGIAVCLDGFYRAIIDAYDARGCRYLLQPSANSIDWNARLPRRPDHPCCRRDSRGGELHGWEASSRDSRGKEMYGGKSRRKKSGSARSELRNKTKKCYVQQSGEWLRCGAGALIQGCENIRAVYNPMCVTAGRLLQHSGRSAVWVNRRLLGEEELPAGREAGGFADAAGPETEGDTAASLTGDNSAAPLPGLLSIAVNEYGEELVYGPIP
jgi:predicted amidohydrolase